MKLSYNFTGAPSPINFREECLKDMSKLKDVPDLAKLVEKLANGFFWFSLLWWAPSCM